MCGSVLLNLEKNQRKCEFSIQLSMEFLCELSANEGYLGYWTILAGNGDEDNWHDAHQGAYAYIHVVYLNYNVQDSFR